MVKAYGWASLCSCSGSGHKPTCRIRDIVNPVGASMHARGWLLSLEWIKGPMSMRVGDGAWMVFAHRDPKSTAVRVMEIVQILFSVAIDTLAAAYLENMIPISDAEQTGRQ
ncbi:hypothetical protein FOXG_03743 [Fusarium oxysporum f. sp. lycopersici 4287]|uniref:Uncharacterized protein n=2 Tax=Fusarium oxysporum TaxID=5507 RepID=A0A0J9UKV8_FUSO4|nr:hypothetical protein FOXG_03743 [Fusarium oxysporum f. sp. lycopersici 4287]KNB00069.1 hypothetical protein FOXG_03743 [Fusarium oxysporum f. sp. lycopersici 4287]